MAVGERVASRGAVLVRNGKIQAVALHVHSPRNTRSVDGRGKMLEQTLSTGQVA